MRARCLLFAVGLAGCASASAGDAFFSTDGQRVTIAPLLQTGVLLSIAIADGSVSPLPLPPELAEAPITALTAGGSGEAIFTTADALWARKADGTARRLSTLPKGFSVASLFVATKQGTPISDWIFAAAENDRAGWRGTTFFARRPGTKDFREIFCRRVSPVGAGTFTPEGRCFFAGAGDLWEGDFEAAEATDKDAPLATLNGARLAPLAMMNTDMANSGNLWVDAVEAAGPWLYVSLRGRHMGSIVRVPLPEKSFYDGGEQAQDLRANLDLMRGMLEKTEIIVADTGGATAFAASEVEGRPRVFYRDESARFHVWEGMGAPRALGREGEAQQR